MTEQQELEQALNDARARYTVAKDERNELVLINAQLQHQILELQKQLKEQNDD